MRIINRLHSIGIAVAVGLISAAAHSAAINLTPTFPDQVTFNAGLSYTYDEGDCLNIGGGPEVSGPCGEVESGGNPDQRYDFGGDHVDGTGGGTLSVVDGLMVLNVDGLGNVQLDGSASYLLEAYFDYTGAITGASLNVTGTILNPADDPGSDFQSGLLAASTSLLDFGFSGINSVGSFEFIFDNATGDMPDYMGITEVYVIVSANDIAGLGSFGDWDPLANNDTTLFTTAAFSSNTALVDTFVPVPAAGWLFGSALLALFTRGRVKSSRI